LLDLGAEKFNSGASEFVEWAGFRDSQEIQCRARRACEVFGLGRRQCSLCPQASVERQRHGSLEERRRRGQATTRLCAAGRSLKLRRDVFVRA
jgi:hypothetical protein